MREIDGQNGLETELLGGHYPTVARNDLAIMLTSTGLVKPNRVLLERRRLLIINTLFIAAASLGCRPSMSTSKYGQDAGSERNASVTIGEAHINFTVEPT